MMKNTISAIACICILYCATVPLNFALRKQLVNPEQEKDLIQQMFGGLRDLVASWASMKAEEYHHQGLPFLKAMEYHSGESSLLGARTGETE